jgi:hypothetical protein
VPEPDEKCQSLCNRTVTFSESGDPEADAFAVALAEHPGAHPPARPPVKARPVGYVARRRAVAR